MLERIVRNLIENALRYTHAGHITLRAVRAGHQVKLEVTDTGVGIPTDERARISRSFIRSAPVAVTPDKDWGLGLPSCAAWRICWIAWCRWRRWSVRDRPLP
ncbi:MAG: ATP-binding protein [Betaproteobacteria bacterium]|nr:ATP-binding protein [Betaproteobacteria bacterium]